MPRQKALSKKHFAKSERNFFHQSQSRSTSVARQRWYKEIKFYQQSSELLIRKANFGRLVREICNEMNATNFKWQPRALEALQEASEYRLVQLFENSYLVTLHAGRVTLFARDIQLALRLNSI